MGIAQRLTVVKQHDTEPARSPPGRFTPNARSHGLPDAPQALRWGGVPAAKHPRKIAHHGPEPNFCTPFPTDGQVFSMQNPRRHTSAQAAPGSARQCREACPHLPPLRAGRGGYPCPLSPLAPRGVNIYVGCTRNGRILAVRCPASIAGPRRAARGTGRSIGRADLGHFITTKMVDIRHIRRPAARPPFFGCDFTRLQARHTATGDTRRMRPHGWWPRPHASRRHAFAHQVAPRAIPTWTQRSAAAPGAFVSAPRAARIAHLPGQKQ